MLLATEVVARSTGIRHPAGGAATLARRALRAWARWWGCKSKVGLGEAVRVGSGLFRVFVICMAEAGEELLDIAVVSLGGADEEDAVVIVDFTDRTAVVDPAGWVDGAEEVFMWAMSAV